MFDVFLGGCKEADLSNAFSDGVVRGTVLFVAFSERASSCGKMADSLTCS